VHDETFGDNPTKIECFEKAQHEQNSGRMIFPREAALWQDPFKAELSFTVCGQVQGNPEELMAPRLLMHL